MGKIVVSIISRFHGLPGRECDMNHVWKGLAIPALSEVKTSTRSGTVKLFTRDLVTKVHSLLKPRGSCPAADEILIFGDPKLLLLPQFAQSMFGI